MTTLTTERPQVEYRPDDHKHLSDAYRHEDGSITYIVWDEFGGEHANPRENDGNVALLIQENSRCLDIDEDVAGLGEARERWAWLNQRHSARSCQCDTCRAYADGFGKGLAGYDREAMMRRYIAMFRPDIVHYEDWWSAGDSQGWGYVTREHWHEHMYPDKPYVHDGMTPTEHAKAVENFLTYEPSITPAEVFDQEVEIYRQWAEGEVYGGIHVRVGEPIVVLSEEGAYIDGYTEDEDSCWGFLGYDDHKDICEQFTDSPITEVLY